MDFLKKQIDRAKQTVEEKFGDAHKTEFSEETQKKLQKGDDIKLYTEKLVSALEIYIQPDPSIRMLPGLTQEGLNKPETVSAEMEHLSSKLGQDKGYGTALTSGCQAFSKIGSLEREFLSKANQVYMTPVKRFLNEDMKTFEKEKGALGARRLDMDSLKGKKEKDPTNETLQLDLERAVKAFEEQETTLKEAVAKLEAHLPELQKNTKALVQAEIDCRKQSLEALQAFDKKL